MHIYLPTYYLHTYWPTNHSINQSLQNTREKYTHLDCCYKFSICIFADSFMYTNSKVWCQASSCKNVQTLYAQSQNYTFLRITGHDYRFVSKHIYTHTHIMETESYTGCPRRNVPDFGRVFLMLKYTDITQNTYVQSWTVTEIMASEVWNFDSYYTLIDYQIHIKTGRKMWFL